MASKYMKRFSTSLIIREIQNKTTIRYHLILVGISEFSCSVVSDSLWPHGLQHARPPCPSPTPGVYSNSWPLSQWCHPAISSSVVPFSSCLQSFPASGSFPMSQIFSSGGPLILVQFRGIKYTYNDVQPIALSISRSFFKSPVELCIH